MTLQQLTETIYFDKDIHQIEGFAHKGNRYAVTFYDDGKVCGIYLRLPDGQSLPLDLVQLDVPMANENFKKLYKVAESVAYTAAGRRSNWHTAPVKNDSLFEAMASIFKPVHHEDFLRENKAS